MTDAARAERLASLQAKRSATSGGRRHPAEAARILIAGAGTAATLTMVAAMARADQVASVVGPEPVVTPVVSGAAPVTTHAVVATSTVATPPQTAASAVQVVTVSPAKTITVSEPARTTTNTRTNGSR